MKILSNWRKIFVISIIVICIICINLAVYLQIIEKDTTSNKNNEIIIDTVALTENFENIFNNTIDKQQKDINNISRIDNSKELVYTNYTKIENNNEIDINIPHINIKNEIIESINKEIDDLFYKNIDNILKNSQNNSIIYNVTYKAYLNDNILSLIIRCNIKENENAQRLVIKTYNYNISSNQILNIEQVLDYRGLDKKTVQNKINNTIQEASKTSSTYQELGYKKYTRNTADEMYILENTKVFFIGEGKSLYILYPYGNSNYTTEIDLVVM